MSNAIPTVDSRVLDGGGTICTGISALISCFILSIPRLTPNRKRPPVHVCSGFNELKTEDQAVQRCCNVSSRECRNAVIILPEQVCFTPVFLVLVKTLLCLLFFAQSSTLLFNLSLHNDRNLLAFFLPQRGIFSVRIPLFFCYSEELH